MMILLVVAPQEYGYGYINKFFWQQGLLHLVAYLQENSDHSLTVEICDGNIRSLDECRRAIVDREPDLVGFHCVDHTKNQTLMLAELAIKNGCQRVVFGGAGAIFGPTQYLSPLTKYCDMALIACCIGAGEECLQGLLEGRPPDRIPNLVFLQEGEVQHSELVKTRPEDTSYLQSLPFPSYSDIMRYVELQLDRPDYPYTPITYSAMSHEGCIHRSRRNNRTTRGCSFCAIPAPRYYPHAPELFWQEILDFNEFCKTSFGEEVNSIKDWGDSISYTLLRRLLDARPQSLARIRYSCYLSISEAQRDTLDLLRRMNCFSVYIGVDGTSNSSLQRLRKPYAMEEVWRALDRIQEYDFRIEIGTILGVEGETQKDLDNTVQFVKEVKDLFDNRTIVLQGNILVPMPGSTTFARLRKRAIRKEQIDPLNLNVEKRIRSWLKHFAHVSFEDCTQAQRLIETISPRRHSYATRASQATDFSLQREKQRSDRGACAE